MRKKNRSSDPRVLELHSDQPAENETGMPTRRPGEGRDDQEMNQELWWPLFGWSYRTSGDCEMGLAQADLRVASPAARSRTVP